MNSKIKFAIAVLVIISTLNLLYIASSDIVESKTITLSDGFIVPNDSQTVIESGIEDGYVQADTQEIAFQASNLEAISSRLATEIIQVEPQLDGTSLVLIREHNTLDAQQFDTVYYERSSLLHVDTNGVVLKSYNLGTTQTANGMAAINDSFTNSVYDVNTQYAASARLLKTETGYKVYYVNSSSEMTNTGYTFNLDDTLNFNNIQPRVNPTGTFIDNPIIFRDYNSVSQIYEDSRMALVETVYMDETILKYQMFNLDVGMTSSLYKELEIPTWEQITGYAYAGGSKTLNSDLYVLPDGSFTGTIRAAINDLEYNGFVIWNEDGTIKAQYLPGLENDIKIIPDLSNSNFLFFQENENSLKKLNLQTGYITLVKAYPTSTNIGLQPYVDSTFNSSYLFYGYVKNFRGIFSELGPNPGAIVGLMDESFNIITANVTPTDLPVTLDLKSNGNQNMVAYGNLGENRQFANEPTPATNSIAGRGWVDKTSGLSTINRNDVYIGKVNLVDDYAPAIKVGAASMINIDQVSSYEQLTSELLNNIEVYDSFDLKPENSLNANLTESEIKLKLYSRINKSPNNLDSNIEWEALGLNSSQVGFNEVRYFITDSNNHVTAKSKIVNIIDNNTNINSSNELALSAENLVLTIEQAKSLTTSQILSQSSAKAWNLNDGLDLTSTISIDSTQLKAINNNNLETVLPLKLTVLQGDKQVTKEIKVFIGGTYDIKTDVIVFGTNFNMPLDEAKSLSLDVVIEKGKISAYYKTNGQMLASDQLEIDFESTKVATDVGHYQIEINALGTKTSLLVNLYDSTTILSNNDAIDAHNVIYTTEEISTLTNEQLKTSIIDKSYVKAWELSSGNKLEYSINVDAVMGKVGVYDVTFVTDNKTEKVIKVFVFKNPTCDGVNCDAKLTTMAIDAVNFNLEVGRVYSLTPVMTIQLSQARAYNVDENIMLKLDVDYSKVKPIPGSYDVKFITCFNIEKTIKATVGDDVVIAPRPPKPPQVETNPNESVVEEQKSESLAISGKDAFFTLEEIDNLQDREELNEEILKRSETKAWLVESNQTLSPITVDSNAVEYNVNRDEPIEMEVNYTNEESFDILEQKYGDNLELHMSDEEAIAAVDFGITVQEVESITADDVKLLASSVAWNLEDMSNVKITNVDLSKLKNQQGVYPIELTTDNGTSLSVNAFVGQNNRPTFTEDGHVIFANDYYTFEKSRFSESETGQHPLSRANGMILDQKTLAEVEGNYFNHNFDSSKPGVYTAILGLDEERSATIEVTVIANQSNTHSMLRMTVFLIIVTFAVTAGIVYYTKANKRLD